MTLSAAAFMCIILEIAVPNVESVLPKQYISASSAACVVIVSSP